MHANKNTTHASFEETVKLKRMCEKLTLSAHRSFAVSPQFHHEGAKAVSDESLGVLPSAPPTPSAPKVDTHIHNHTYLPVTTFNRSCLLLPIHKQMRLRDKNKKAFKRPTGRRVTYPSYIYFLRSVQSIKFKLSRYSTLDKFG